LSKFLLPAKFTNWAFAQAFQYYIYKNWKHNGNQKKKQKQKQEKTKAVHKS